MTFFIHTFGCQMNVNDSEKMRSLLLQQGHLPAADAGQAEVVIVNTCAVRKKAQEKLYSYIGRLPVEARIIVTGCVAQVEAAEIRRRLPRVSAVLGTHQWQKIGEFLETGDDSPGRIHTGFSASWREYTPLAEARESNVTAFVSIMEGCDNFCSYCIVPYARGRETFRPARAILNEISQLAGKGCPEVILLGQNVNHWQDCDLGLDFPALLELIASRADIPWLRFITSYPGYHEDEIIRVMSRYPAILRHIHLPAQSGSTRMLKLMNRSYDRGTYLGIIDRFRRAMPGTGFSSDFIVGFPGESEHDFKLTLSLLEKVAYDSVYSFVYSPRPGTAAARLSDNIPLEIKKDRLQRLQSLQEEIQAAANLNWLGRNIKVLVSGTHPRRSDESIGRTEWNRVVNLKPAQSPGSFVQVQVTRYGPHSLSGRVVPG